MSLKVQNGRLPVGYDLQLSVTGEGRRWEVIELATGYRVVRNQRNQVLAVDRALAMINSVKTRGAS
jgi:hypothetical protein